MSGEMDKIGEWINSKLRERGWSQAELARRAGVSRTSISDAISGKENVGSNLATAIARALDVSEMEVLQLAGIVQSNHSIDDRAARLAYRIGQLPAEDQEIIDAMIDGLFQRRKIRGENKVDLPENSSTSQT